MGKTRAWIRSNTLGLVAIFIALGGTTYAANKVDSADIDRNAVRSKHIGAGQVKTADVADGAVTSPKLADDAVGSQKVAPDSLTGADLDEASLGKVPSAANADTADTADTASTAGSAQPSGPAGGELAGNYPNPTVGTVNGLDLTESTSPDAGIDFGSDTSLYRIGSEALQTQALYLNPPPGFTALGVDGQAYFGPGLPFNPALLLDRNMIRFNSPSPGNGYMEFSETTGVANSFSNTVKLTARDDGAGHTQLIAVFPNEGGPQDIQTIAVDPDIP